MKSLNLLAALSVMGVGGPDSFMPRLPSPRKRYVPQPVDHEAECRKFDDKVMRHRVTGEVRDVLCRIHSGVSFCSITSGKVFHRSWRKALDWIRNADVVEPDRPVFSGSWGAES